MRPSGFLFLRAKNFHKENISGDLDHWVFNKKDLTNLMNDLFDSEDFIN